MRSSCAGRRRKSDDAVEFDPVVRLDPSPGFDFSGLSPAVLKNFTGSDMRIPFDPKVLHESNNWAVSGALTVSGKPLLANDPHRVLAEPSLRYVVPLGRSGWNVIGAASRDCRGSRGAQ